MSEKPSVVGAIPGDQNQRRTARSEQSHTGRSKQSHTARSEQRQIEWPETETSPAEAKPQGMSFYNGLKSLVRKLITDLSGN